jgi:CheY-like chemotaxis protein
MEAIGTLAGGIAHDFNNILSAVIGYSEIVLDKCKDDDPLKEYLQEIFNAGVRARELVKQILTFSRQAEQELQPLQVKLMVNEALKLLRASLPATIEIRRDLQSDDTVMADPTQIHQILMNLCTNAAHAMQENGGILNIGLTTAELDDSFVGRYPEAVRGSYLRLTVSDTGHGMPAEVVGKIFNPFFTTKEKEEGTGMGLAVVHGIVKGHGGLITVQSEPGKGTTFEVYFPLAKEKARPEIKVNEPLPTGNEHILFIDDEKPLIDIGQQMLERQGYKVTIRTSSIEALELFKARSAQFDLVVTDMTMPNMTGIELGREIMAIRPDIPVILCTGFSEKVTEESVKSIGIRALLMKPVTVHNLAWTVRRVLDEGIGS